MVVVNISTHILDFCLREMLTIWEIQGFVVCIRYILEDQCHHLRVALFSKAIKCQVVIEELINSYYHKQGHIKCSELLMVR